MDQQMLDAGGKKHRENLISAMEALSIGSEGRQFTEDEARIAAHGDLGQAEGLNAKKRAR
jgi:hypothetical protein